jgi:DDE superfamily endonuclease
VQDNLNTHSAASLYEAFAASEARRLIERFEWHYTPKQGSWLNMAESELAILSSQCQRSQPSRWPTRQRGSRWAKDDLEHLVLIERLRRDTSGLRSDGLAIRSSVLG